MKLKIEFEGEAAEVMGWVTGERDARSEAWAVTTQAIHDRDLAMAERDALKSELQGLRRQFEGALDQILKLEAELAKAAGLQTTEKNAWFRVQVMESDHEWRTIAAGSVLEEVLPFYFAACRNWVSVRILNNLNAVVKP